MLLKFKPFAAPASYEFKDPDTGFQFKGGTIADVCSKIRSYRQQNELPDLDYLEAVVEHYVCSRRKYRSSCIPRGVLKRGLMPTIRGGVTVLKNLMFGDFVAQEVADARSAQCATCKFNVFPDRGPFIKWSDTIAINSVGDRRSSHHDELGTCDVCSCPLRAKVFAVSPFSLSAKETLKMKEVNCWQLFK